MEQKTFIPAVMVVLVMSIVLVAAADFPPPVSSNPLAAFVSSPPPTYPSGDTTTDNSCTQEQELTYRNARCGPDGILLREQCKPYLYSLTGHWWYPDSVNCYNNGPGWICNSDTVAETSGCYDAGVGQCESDAECKEFGGHYICSDWACVAGCRLDSECDINFKCVSSRCMYAPSPKAQLDLLPFGIIGAVLIGGAYYFREEITEKINSLKASLKGGQQ